MLEHLRRPLDETGLLHVHVRLIRDNSLDLAAGGVDRVPAVNLRHEVIRRDPAARDTAPSPIGRLPARGGLASGQRAEGGTPAEVSRTPQAARDMLGEAGHDVAAIQDGCFPYHFVYLARIPAEDRL